MAVKGKVTRLGDPANPYTKKKVSAAEAAASAKQAAASKPKAKAPERKKPSVMDTVRSAVSDLKDKPKAAMKDAQYKYQGYRDKRIDRAVDKASK